MNFQFFKDLTNQENLIINLQRLDQEFFPEPWSINQWKQINEGLYFVSTVSNGKDILGFALYLFSPHERLVHLIKILTVPNSRKKHLATELFRSTYSQFKSLGVEKCYLEVSCENYPAIAFYKSLGFNELNRIPRFYSNGSDAFTMELSLPLNN